MGWPELKTRIIKRNFSCLFSCSKGSTIVHFAESTIFDLAMFCDCLNQQLSTAALAETHLFFSSHATGSTVVVEDVKVIIQQTAAKQAKKPLPYSPITTQVVPTCSSVG